MSSSYFEFGMAWGNQNFPVLLNIFYFALNSGFNEFYIRILIPLWSIFNAILVYMLSEKLFRNKNVSIISVALFVSVNVFSAYSVFTLAPMYVLFYPLLSFYFFVLYEKEKKTKLLLLTSLLFGISISLKYVWVIPFIILILSMVIVKREIKIPILIFVITSLVSMLFYLRNIIYYGDPFFPLLFCGKTCNEFLNSLFWKSYMIPDFTNIGMFLDTIFKTGLLIWVFFALFGIFMFKNTPHTNKILYLFALLYLPFFLANSAFLPNTDGQRHLLPQLAIMSTFAGMYLWENIKKQIRLTFAFIPMIVSVLIILTGFAFDAMGKDLILLIALPPMLLTPLLILKRMNKIDERKMFALILVLLMLTPIGYVSSMKRVKLWEFPSEEEVIRKYWDDIYETGQYMKENLPDGTKVFSIENRRYYFNAEIIPANHPDMIFDYHNNTLEYVLRKLYDMDIKYILISPLWENKGAWNYSTIHTNSDKLEMNTNIEKQFEYKNITLYKIVYE
jgi:4-amino-4-deoxy-L-arabinose transferase-like glycosyltransferase